MNIVINAVLSYEQPRGVGRYINNLLPALADIDKKNKYYVYYGSWMKEYSFLNIHQNNFTFIKLEIINNKLLRNLYLATVLPLLSKKHKPDIYFLIDTQATLIKPCKILSTIHDLAEFVVPEKYSKTQAFIRRVIVKNQVHISDKIITVSNYSKNDICNRFSLKEDSVQVIYNSVDICENSSLESPEKYFLYVSEIERAKNLNVLIEAYNELDKEDKDNYVVRVVGKKGNDYDNIIDKIRRYGLENNVLFYGYISDTELNDLYKKAYAFVFPSLFEGFGLPVLEAMAKGTPVICSNSSSIPEVGGDAVLLFNPRDKHELKNCLLKIIEDTELRKEMIKRGIKQSRKFTKEICAKQTKEVIENMKFLK